MNARRKKMIGDFHSGKYERASTREGGWRKPRITEDDPRWNPKTMGNKRGSMKKTPGQKRWDPDDPSNYRAQPRGHGRRRA